MYNIIVTISSHPPAHPNRDLPHHSPASHARVMQAHPTAIDCCRSLYGSCARGKGYPHVSSRDDRGGDVRFCPGARRGYSAYIPRYRLSFESGRERAETVTVVCGNGPACTWEVGGWMGEAMREGKGREAGGTQGTRGRVWC